MADLTYCPACNGEGFIEHMSANPDLTTHTYPCSQCIGTGLTEAGITEALRRVRDVRAYCSGVRHVSARHVLALLDGEAGE